MQRAEVLEWDLQRQLIPYMKKIQPLPSIYIPDFIAANQADRANNVIDAKTKKEMVEHIRNDIKVMPVTKYSSVYAAERTFMI